ncbi:helix-turn-helix domain-containing protein [Lactobacillus delbrueckii]|uniref:helix-turn-helix domain-containing protein n=1 Tax=Lactobacillus delbrueckii TaxID=1584 RepID=UPI003A87F0AA
MTNRIKELRKANHMTQAELAKKLGVSSRALGNYERGDRRVSKEMLAKLANIFGVSPGYVLGEMSEEGVIKHLMNFYNNHAFDDHKVKGINISLASTLRNRTMPVSLWSKLSNYFIGNGIVPYNIQNTRQLLQPDQASSVDFWKNEFSWLITNPTFAYLKSTNENVPDRTFEMMLATAIAGSYESELLPNVHYANKESKEWVDEDSEFRQRLVKREKFLNANAVPNAEPDFIDPYGQAYYGWRYTWQLGLPVVEIE